MKRTLVLTLAVVTAVSLAACGSSGGSSSDPTAAASLPGTSWQLTSYPVEGKATKVPEGVTVTAEFADDTLNGNGGCNNYRGSYKTDGSNISIGPVSSTMMACDALAIETAFTTALDAASTYTATTETLTLTTKTGQALEFAKAVPK